MIAHPDGAASMPSAQHACSSGPPGERPWTHWMLTPLSLAFRRAELTLVAVAKLYGPQPPATGLRTTNRL